MNYSTGLLFFLGKKKIDILKCSVFADLKFLWSNSMPAINDV